MGTRPCSRAGRLVAPFFLADGRPVGRALQGSAGLCRALQGSAGTGWNFRQEISRGENGRNGAEAGSEGSLPPPWPGAPDRENAATASGRSRHGPERPAPERRCGWTAGEGTAGATSARLGQGGRGGRAQRGERRWGKTRSEWENSPSVASAPLPRRPSGRPSATPQPSQSGRPAPRRGLPVKASLSLPLPFPGDSCALRDGGAVP